MSTDTPSLYTNSHEAVLSAIRDGPCPDGRAPTTDRVLAEATRGRALTRVEAVRVLEGLAEQERVYTTGGRWRCRS